MSDDRPKRDTMSLEESTISNILSVVAHDQHQCVNQSMAAPRKAGSGCHAPHHGVVVALRVSTLADADALTRSHSTPLPVLPRHHSWS